jgi:hypothetical protein
MQLSSPESGALLLVEAQRSVAYCPPRIADSPLPGHDHPPPGDWEVRVTYPLHIPLCHRRNW